MKTRNLFLLYFISIVQVYAQWSYPANHSWSAINEESNAEERLDLIIEKARYFYYVEEDWSQADSVIKVPLTWNKEDFSTGMYYYNLGIYGNLKSFEELEQSFSKDFRELKNVDDWWQFWLEIRFFEETFNSEQGLTNVENLIQRSKSFSDSSFKGLAYLERAKLNAIQNNKIEALRDFLLAKDVFAHAQAYDLAYYLNKELVYFYISVDLADEAVKTSNDAFDLLPNLSNPDSLTFHQAVFHRNYSLYYQNRVPILDVFKDRIKWARKKGQFYMLSYYTSVYRTYLISNGQYSVLKDFYLSQYPVDFEQLKSEDLPLYLRLRAYFHEIDGQIDSANYYWKKNLAEYEQIDDPVKHANMHFRHAEFLMRHGEEQQAIQHLHQAILLDRSGNDLTIQQKAVQALQNIYVNQGEMDSAFFYLKNYHVLNDSINSMNEKDKLVLAEVLHQTNVRQREQEEKMRIQDVKISGFAVGFILFLMLSGITFYQYRLTKQEKRRSDELLLNILPESTAEELKEKGKTTALKYTGVTVFFADFVGFTHVAEKLEAAELVEVIDRFFRTFDQIMSDHGLEKIKTIGDAYMAVAGLPEGNKATAVDAVLAARDIIRAVKELNEETPSRPNLQVRIGLHTGEVVAGVVGTKKFQFDIWGDAVNVAARMEQSGYPNQINISATTFSKVKESISCTHRGKVHAKNKGELDMYFVDLA